VTITKVAQFWDDRPCNVRHSSVDINAHPLQYSLEVRDRKYRVEPHIPMFAEFSRWKGKSVLELGCGIGTDTLSFAAHGANVTAVDISEKSLEIAYERAKAEDLQNIIHFVQADMEYLCEYISPRPYDLVYSFGAIHHTPRPQNVIHQIQSFMDNTSILKIMLYHRCTTKVLKNVIMHWRWGMSIDDAVACASEAQRGSPVTYTYTKQTASKLLRNFQILSMKTRHIFPYRVKEYTQYKYIMAAPWRWMPKWLFHWFSYQFGWHICVTAKLKRRGKYDISGC
jgi:ubiquinone/menaquinone biosynthesis C-methylase UbiE